MFVSDLAFDDVHKSYGKFQALKGVTLEVRSGEVFGLLGPNGAGKTTLIRIALDIIRADRGTVTLFGRPLVREDLDRVSYLPEERGLYRRQRVLEGRDGPPCRCAGCSVSTGRPPRSIVDPRPRVPGCR